MRWILATLLILWATICSARLPTVNGTNTALHGDNTFATTSGLPLANGTNTFTTVIAFPGGATFTNITTPYLPTPVAFQYDANGNLIFDGARGFGYDDEDRLTTITTTNFWRTQFFYDGLSRKRVLRESAWNSTGWATQSETRYVYDGLLILQERDSNNMPLVTYTRGLDLSGTMQGAGGIGGLLARTDSKGSVFYHSDGNGNVTALVDAQQTLEARYLYDPLATCSANGDRWPKPTITASPAKNGTTPAFTTMAAGFTSRTCNGG